MPYVLTLSIMALTAGLLWGRFTIRRPATGKRELDACVAGTIGNFVETSLPDLEPRGPLHHFSVSNVHTSDLGTEYYFDTKVGLLAIVPHRELPSAVELLIGGKTCASFISAEFAANAVGLGLTGHKELDALLAEERPAKLKDWQASRPHHFKT